jgi:hypothetical protein
VLATRILGTHRNLFHIYVGFISNIRGNNFTKVVASQHIARGHALMGCMSLGLVSILVPLGHNWILLNLQMSVRSLRSLLPWLRLCLVLIGVVVLADPGASTFWRGTSRPRSLRVQAQSLRGLH